MIFSTYTVYIHYKAIQIMTSYHSASIQTAKAAPSWLAEQNTQKSPL